MLSSAKPESDPPPLNVAFIGHSYHKATKSSQFFIDLLTPHYDIDFFWDESWNKQGCIDFGATKRKVYDLVILYQVMCPVYQLSRLKYRSLLLVPMYDEVFIINRADFFWSQYKGAAVLCFSKVLHEKFKRLGLESKYFQFFPSPARTSNLDKTKKLKAFFWHRTNELGWETIKQLISPGIFEQIYIHSTPDPPLNKKINIPREDIKNYNIITSTWFEKRENFLALLNECDVFFAPRLYEGIGMSFLEAMALGKCVVAPDNPTMNEYITDGKTGILYDPANPLKVDFSGIENIKNNVLESVKMGHEKWINDKDDIYTMIDEGKPRKNKMISSYILTYFDKVLRFTLKHRNSRMC